jgi:hypothetical protein
VLQAFGVSTLTNDFIRSAIVLVGGGGGVVGWKVKALGWNQELWTDPVLDADRRWGHRRCGAWTSRSPIGCEGHPWAAPRL